MKVCRGLALGLVLFWVSKSARVRVLSILLMRKLKVMPLEYPASLPLEASVLCLQGRDRAHLTGQNQEFTGGDQWAEARAPCPALGRARETAAATTGIVRCPLCWLEAHKQNTLGRTKGRILSVFLLWGEYCSSLGLEAKDETVTAE